ncbi:hypothetical protein L596_017858 [Steinernema carpocapsae]|uniref:Uncharacterized protein n=1 Tax=Steinernema carpocapsae TaxID=34508 RepID=A0A4V6XW38_STECR|nr:hypothetical protein L596_017858 [Steinernema carpocapsae]
MSSYDFSNVYIIEDPFVSPRPNSFASSTPTHPLIRSRRISGPDSPNEALLDFLNEVHEARRISKSQEEYEKRFADLSLIYERSIVKGKLGKHQMHPFVQQHTGLFFLFPLLLQFLSYCLSPTLIHFGVSFVVFIYLISFVSYVLGFEA